MQYEQELNKISKLINLEIKFRNNDNLFYWNQVIENLISYLISRPFRSAF